MEVLYRSTRGNEESVSASKAILEGLASDGGLFVPQALPSFDKTLDEFAQMDYRQTAYEVMKLLLTDFTEEELRYCIDKAYDGKFDTEAIAPLAEVKNAWYLELFHGDLRRYRKGGSGRFCGCARHENYGLLSQGRC